MISRTELIAYLDSYLEIHAMDDFSSNGLQVEGAQYVELAALAVDACQITIDKAAELGAQMLIVHHGLFWGEPLFLVGPHLRRVRSLLDANCSLYAVHLPLDAHNEVGNNVQLAHILSLEVTGPFGDVGVATTAPEGLLLERLVSGVRHSLGIEPQVFAGGGAEIRHVALMSGRATREISLAAQQGFDTFITGEPVHDIYHEPEEYGINVVFAGHYATETLGLKALSEHLAAKFDLQTAFIDAPTGL